MSQKVDDLHKKVVSLAKRRGFVFPGSEIYGGLANTYDLGPLGVELLRNVASLWWQTFVTNRSDMFGLDTSILMSPKVWEASGHTASFTDVLVDCFNCHYRTRADHLIEDYFEKKGHLIKVEGYDITALKNTMVGEEIPCPKCDEFRYWSVPRKFNLLFETKIGVVEESESLVYLRGEIAQGMFVNFRNILDTMRPKLPFGIAQAGKAFRNEITLGNFVFRTLEFNLAEFEYFFNPQMQNWETLFEYWKKELEDWILSLGIDKDLLRWRPHSDEERAHYSMKTEDLDFDFGFGFKEMCAVAYRTDYDLRNHMEKSGVDLRYIDPNSDEKFIPHVIEPTFGLNRILLSLLTNGYREESDRIILKLAPKVAPYKVAVFPLVRNKEEIILKAREIYENLLKSGLSVVWDDRGNIGKRYLSQDEIGTPWCVTVDYDTLDNDTVTVRDRDTTEQQRLKVSELLGYFKQSLS